MYALQEKYINELFPENKYVNKQVVIDYVNSLPPQRLMYAVNYIYKQNALDTKKWNNLCNNLNIYIYV